MALLSYQRYLLKHLVLPTVLITITLTGMVWLTQMLRFVDFMINRGLSVGDFLYLTGLMLPSLLLILLPISVCIAVMYAYQKLTNESELIVFSSVGISRTQLAKPVIVLGLACTLICYALSLYIMPLANQKFRDIRTFFREQYASVLLEEDVFNSPLDGLTVFIRQRDRANNLFGILLHDNRNAEKTMTLSAEEGRLEQGESGPRFYLRNGLRQEVKNGEVSWLSFDEYALDINFYAQASHRYYEPKERPFLELFATENLPADEVAALRAEAHQRLSWPLMASMLPLWIVAVMLASEFNRRGGLRRVLIATGSLVMLAMIYFSLRNIAVHTSWVAVLVYAMILTTALASVAVLRSGRGPEQWWRALTSKVTHVGAR